MRLGPALVRWRNFVRFGATLRRLERDGSSTALLMQWRALTREYGLEFVPGNSLGASQLRGMYDGLPVRIGLAADEIRVLTTFSLGLPGPARPDLLEAIALQSNLLERSNMLLDAFEEWKRDSSGSVYRRNSLRLAPSDIRESLGWCDLNMTETHLYGTARYVNDVSDYAKILAVMSAVSRAITRAPAGS